MNIGIFYITFWICIDILKHENSVVIFWDNDTILRRCILKYLQVKCVIAFKRFSKTKHKYNDRYTCIHVYMCVYKFIYMKKYKGKVLIIGKVKE